MEVESVQVELLRLAAGKLKGEHKRAFIAEVTQAEGGRSVGLGGTGNVFAKAWPSVSRERSFRRTMRRPVGSDLKICIRSLRMTFATSSSHKHRPIRNSKRIGGIST